MDAIIKFFCLVFFLGLMSTGSLQCYPGKVTVHQVRTGNLVQNKPEWKVTVANECPCTQEHVTLSCAGFKTVKKVDPQVMAVFSGGGGGDLCLINKDMPIYGHTSVNFTYAWDRPFSFGLASSQEACS